MPPAEAQGVDSANSFFYIKQKYCIHQHAFLCSNIQHSTFHQPQAGPPLSPERETCCMLSFCTPFPSCPFNIYENTFHFTPAICKDCTVSRIRQDSCRLMSLGSYRPENGYAIFADSERSLRLSDTCSNQPSISWQVIPPDFVLSWDE